MIKGTTLQRPSISRLWFILDLMGLHLKAYEFRPLNDNAKPLKSIPLADIAQVVRVKNKHEFRLCDSANATVAHLICDDESNLLWWLHGFQRRIFEQAKNYIREQRSPRSHTSLAQTQVRPVLKLDRGDSTVFEDYRARTKTTTGGAPPSIARLQQQPKRPQSPIPSEWIFVTQASQQGRRRNMEDETVCILDLNKEHQLAVDKFGALSCFCIFDGHAGREAADYAGEFLVTNMIESEPFKALDFEKALSASFLQTDEEFRGWAMENENISGSTAIAILIRDKTIYCANCGDCRAVLYRGGKAIPLSVDHKPNRPDERARVEQAGGWVEDNEVLNIPKLHAMGLEHTELLEEDQELIGWVVVSKVMGALAMTRSFGDILIKDQLSDNFDSALENGLFAGPLVIAEPEIKVEKMQERDSFLIIACDGLWDVFSSEEACVFVREAIEEKIPREDIADNLITRAIAMGSLDNVSVVILFFDHSKTAK